MKTCNKCGETKPLDAFIRDASSRGGRTARCRKCANDAARLRRAGGRLDQSPGIPPTMKRCSKCRKTKDRGHYVRSAQKKDGLYPTCKECTKELRQKDRDRIAEYGRAYYQENRDRIAQQARDYRERNADRLRAKKREHYEANKDRYREWGRAWAEANRPAVNEHSRRWRESNPDRRREINRRYYERNREEILQRARERYDSERAREYYLSRRAEILDHQKNNPHIGWASSYRTRSRALGITQPHMELFTKADVIERYGESCFYCEVGEFEHLDHALPVSEGGPHTLDNVRPSCGACNLSKSDKHPDEWLAEQAEIDALTEEELEAEIEAEIARWTD